MAMMFVLVTGASGMLGKQLCNQLWRNDIQYVGFDKNVLDIGDSEKLETMFTTLPITHVVNCAAYTNVGQAELEPDIAYKINGYYTETLADKCKKFRIKLVHISTDYVFDGHKDMPYSEDDAPCPLNIYGRSKLRGEEAVTNLVNDSVILRIQWLYGLYGDNFIKKILRNYRRNQDVTVINSELGSPSSAYFISKVIVKVLKKFDFLFDILANMIKENIVATRITDGDKPVRRA